MPVLAYCATLNNYTDEDVAILRTPRAELKYIIVGHEVGEEGTPHLQIYFQLERNVKFTTIKRWNNTFSRMHFEASRGSDTDNYEYCKKQGNFFEIGTRKTMGRKGARNDIEAVKEAVDKGESFDDICSHSFETCARYSSFIKSRIVARDNQKAKEKLVEEYEGVVWKPWQQRLLDLVEESPDPRKIMWFWDHEGNKGKSFLSTYLSLTKNAVVLGQGKKADLAHIWAEQPGPEWPVVIFDVSRQVIQMEEGRDGQQREKKPISHLLALAEEMKNGRVTSTKYASTVVYRPPPHVIFFANFEPERDMLSADRWLVHHLT